ncbi:unnamed protein product [Toxocara canis]|uniref:Methyltransf_11 domain-containing protein n=1 Tax=Toxocara canis TaxID=6265 RepID=A0A183VDC4_TOXCA|nr:unnamed protein product [Toxocara canis]
MEIEKQYVHDVYSRLATHSAQTESNKKLRIWPNVKSFISDLPPGSIVIDVGCGQMKYHINNGFLLGSDTCPEVLRQVHKHPFTDLHLAHALQLPYRDESIDAALFVSVLHHFSTLERRRKALAEIARCIKKRFVENIDSKTRYSRGRVLIYAWAFEQPNGSFTSQDVLVPWHLHENPSNGELLGACINS